MNINDPKHPVSFFQSDTAGGGIWGRAGVVAGPDGTIYAETGDGAFDPAAAKYGDAFLALSPRELKLKDLLCSVELAVAQLLERSGLRIA